MVGEDADQHLLVADVPYYEVGLVRDSGGMATDEAIADYHAMSGGQQFGRGHAADIAGPSYYQYPHRLLPLPVDTQIEDSYSLVPHGTIVSH